MTGNERGKQIYKHRRNSRSIDCAVFAQARSLKVQAQQLLLLMLVVQLLETSLTNLRLCTEASCQLTVCYREFVPVSIGDQL